MYITPQTLITIGAVIGVVAVIIGYYNKVYNFVLRQQAQDKELQGIKSELTLLTYGLLAALKGLQEQGCDGPVTDGIAKIEKHLNQAAHGQSN